MKLLPVAALLLGFFLTPALAQTTAPADLDPAKVALGGKIFDLLISKQDLQGRLAALQQVVVQNMPQNAAQPQQAARAQAVLSGIGPIMQSMVPQMREAYAQGYARHFTLDELQAIYAFYQSPVGAKMTAETPAVSMEVMQAILPQMMARIQALVPATPPPSPATPTPKP